MNGHDHQSRRPYGGLRRRLVVVLVMLLCPVLIVTTPNVASAASVEQSAGVEWDIGGLSIGGFGALECDATVTTTTYISYVNLAVTGLDCYGGPDASPGFSQPGEPGSSFTLWVTGTNCGGSASGVFAAGESDSAWRVHGVGSAAWDAGPPSCDPATLCLKVDGAGSIRQGCSTLDLAPATATDDPGTCVGMSIPRPTAGAKSIFNDAGFAGKYWQQAVTSDFTVTQPKTGKWILYTIMAKKDRSATGTWRNAGLGTNTGVLGSSTTVHDLGYALWWDYAVERINPGVGAHSMVGNVTIGTNYPDTSGTPDPVEDGEIIGVGVAWENPLYPGQWRETRRTNANGMLGINDPNTCSFYWGPKLAEVGGTTVDDPAGHWGAAPTSPVPDPYVPGANDGLQEEGCAGFSWTDPASWTGAASCMIVALLQRLVDVMGKLLASVGEIAGAILGGLAGLFTPSPDSWGLEGLRTQWDNRGPGQVVGEVGDGLGAVADGYETGGGCGSLADFSNDDISAHVTCASIRDQPGMAALYGLVQAGLIALTCWGIWHIVVGSIKARE